MVTFALEVFALEKCLSQNLRFTLSELTFGHYVLKWDHTLSNDTH